MQNRMISSFAKMSLFALIIFAIDVILFFYQPLDSSHHIFYIERGASLKEAAHSLSQDQGLNRPFYLKTALWLHQIKVFHYGHYVLDKNDNVSRLIRKIKRQEIYYHKFKIVPGWRWSQLKQALQQHSSLKITLTDLDKENLFLKSQGLDSMEGIFAPNTYYVTYGTLDIEVLKMALRQRKEELQDPVFRESQLDTQKLIILASILEKEGRNKEDYVMMGSVYHNRLAKGMRLQSDPTVAYGFNPLPDRLTLKELSVRHPHNTYRYKGLPPTAISYPSKDAMIGAANPAQTPYLYFITGEEGKRFYSKDYQEHLNAKKILREQRASREL